MHAFSLFSTPVAVFDVERMEETNRELVARLGEEESSQPSWQRANVGGWHSVPDLSQRSQPCFRHLMQVVVDHVTMTVQALARDVGRPLPPYRWGVQSWAMVMRDGHYVTPHDHGDVHWSVAYYVDAGDAAPEPSGQLAFLDPRRSGRTLPGVELFPSVFTIQPRTSALVVFPGWLQHFVHVYRGSRPRICISCNLTAEPG